MVLALQLANPEKKFFNKNEINDLLKYFNDSSNFKAHCWNYILKRNFLIKNKIYFKKIKIFEDQIFVRKNLFYVRFLKIYLLVSKKNEIKKISTFIKKNIHNFSILKQDSRNKILHKKILKDIFKIFFLYRNYAEVLFNNFNMREASLVYIFGAGILGRIIGQILKNNNIRTLAFLDNNRYFHNKKCLGLKIINSKYLAKLNAYDLEKLLVIISHKDAI